MLSSTCDSTSRGCRAPVISRNRSASVDLPWSMCAMIEKLRTKRGSMRGAIVRQSQLSGPRPQAQGPSKSFLVWSSELSGSRAFKLSGSSAINRQKLLRIRRPDVVRTRPDQPVVGVLLEDVRRPSGDAAHREDRRVEINRNPERVERRRGVEVDVRIELLLARDDRLDALRELEPLRLPRFFAELLRESAQVCRPRILGAVHA